MRIQRDLFTDGTVAHISLRDQIAADAFRAGKVMRVASPLTDLTAAPDAGPERQILYGHPVCLLEPRNGLSRDETSGYVGCTDPAHLADWVAPTHRVTARSTFLFDDADFKTPAPLHVSCGSLLRISQIEGKYARTHDGRYAILNHLTDVTESQPDLCATAEKFLGTPYLWAGNSAFGIDCSGLVQLACQAAGIPCPGDSDQQMKSLGHLMGTKEPPKRNDLLFWKGHVALVYDDHTLVHANAHHMAVVLEPISDAIKRIEQQGDGPVIAHKRL